jgi:DNA-binding transcriptional MocR family regulator
VLTEQPSYDRAIATFRRHAKQTIGVPLQSDGIDVELLEALVKREVPAFLYLIPDFQNPSGATLSLAKRHKIVELANTYNFWVLEDVPYRKLRYQGEELPMLRDIDPRRVITLSSFSKLLSPGMRVGYMIGPEEVIASIAGHAEQMYLAPVLPTQGAVTEFIQRGWLEPNIENLRALYKPRWRAMLDATGRYLPGAQVMPTDGGFFIGVTLPAEANTARLVERAKEQELILTSGASFFADPAPGETVDGEKFVRLPFCAVTPEQIDEGVRRLSTLL